MSYQDTAAQMLRFIEESPTSYQVIANLKQMLENEGYREWKEEEAWEITGEKFYVVRNDSSLIALQFPKAVSGMPGPKGFHVIASHSDSPSFKIKANPQISAEGGYVKLNTEKYGGMILSTWLDRPLSVAGRVALQTDTGIRTQPVDLKEDLCVIPNLAIHMNREINKGMEYNPQVDMLPLFGMGEMSKEAFLEKVAGAAGVKAEEILDYDLFLYLREKGRFIGAGQEFVLSPRLDDLQCVYASMKAFLAVQPEEYINVCAVFDNEEVGSGTRQGADSTFLRDTLLRCSEALKYSNGEFCRLVAGSFLISADNAHAVHPNHPEKADPVNRPRINGGIVIKYHGCQKYTSDAFSAGKMKSICLKAGVPFQSYTNRSDVAGGSTLGNISTAHVSVPSVDIGLPQLAMHSAMETAGSHDTEYAVQAFKVFYEE